MFIFYLCIHCMLPISVIVKCCRINERLYKNKRMAVFFDNGFVLVYRFARLDNSEKSLNNLLLVG